MTSPFHPIRYSGAVISHSRSATARGGGKNAEWVGQFASVLKLSFHVNVKDTVRLRVTCYDQEDGAGVKVQYLESQPLIVMRREC